MAEPKKKSLSKKKTVKKIVVKKTIARKKPARRAVKKIALKKYSRNPIVEPRAGSFWETRATFNPSAIINDGKVHMIYRAVGDTDMSVFGYAESKDGFDFSKSPHELAYYRKINPPKIIDLAKIDYLSGGGGAGGCEDPRLTVIDGRLYMLYTAFDGWGSVRIALTSISLADFIARRFHWSEPIFISPPHEINKNWVLFPEKIKGKFAILHSISPTIRIDYFKSLDELDGKKFIHSVNSGSPEWKLRDGLIRGVGPAPLETKYGWLVFYHKIDRSDPGRYKLWAMILDKKDPTRILYNSAESILAPDFWYENDGHKRGVVYSCGAIVKDGKLFVYYGGADTVSCVATADLDKFLEELIRTGKTKLK